MVRLKDANDDYDDYLIILFQFLMVRLKVYFMQNKTRAIGISIPYGAIKSNKYTNEAYTIFKFQFLMVRLKAVAPANQK